MRRSSWLGFFRFLGWCLALVALIALLPLSFPIYLFAMFGANSMDRGQLGYTPDTVE